jgi:hypothetical protein
MHIEEYLVCNVVNVVLEYTQNRPFFHDPLCVALPLSYLFESAAVSITEEHRQRTESDSLITSNILYAEMI